MNIEIDIDTEKIYYKFKIYKVDENNEKIFFTSYNIDDTNIENEVELLEKLGYKTGDQEVKNGDSYYSIE